MTLKTRCYTIGVNFKISIYSQQSLLSGEGCGGGAKSPTMSKSTLEDPIHTLRVLQYSESFKIKVCCYTARCLVSLRLAKNTYGVFSFIYVSQTVKIHGLKYSYQPKIVIKNIYIVSQAYEIAYQQL